MTKILTTCLIVLTSYFMAFSQKDSSLVSRHRPGIFWYFNGLRPLKSSSTRKYDRLIVDLNHNSWKGDQKAFSNRWNSIGINTNLLFDLPLNPNNQFSIGTGIAYSWINIAFDPALNFSTYSNQTILDSSSLNSEFNHQKLSANTLSIPFEIRFRTKGWQHFKIHLGGKIGYQINTYSTSTRKDENGKYRVFNNNFADINQLIYSAHVRFGIRNWAIYASYNFNSLFSHPASVNLNLFQLGLSISIF